MLEHASIPKMSICYNQQKCNCITGQTGTQCFQINNKRVYDYYNNYSQIVVKSKSCANAANRADTGWGRAENEALNERETICRHQLTKMYEISKEGNYCLSHVLFARLNHGLFGYLIQTTNCDRHNNNTNDGIKSILLLLIIVFGFCINITAGGEF